jgi:toxin ParE1/3/4
MAFQVIWSISAVEDLREIVLYIASDDPDAAARLADHILVRIEAASSFPLSHRAVPEKADKAIREIILKPYRIVYHVDEKRKAIHILRIWHAARGVPEIG